MVPAHLLTVEAFPLNTSGKIDKALLPAPDADRPRRRPTAAPRTLVETVLADMYARLLGLERVGVDDGFFDLGGNSLQAMRLVTLHRDELAADIDSVSPRSSSRPPRASSPRCCATSTGSIDIELADEEGATQ